MIIREAARRSGLTSKAIRHYERIGLIPRPARDRNGYRHFDDTAVARLRFIAQARRMGFDLDSCRALLALYGDERRSARDVRALALQKIAEIDGRLNDLGRLRETLVALVSRCHGDSGPECPILDRLSSDEDAASFPVVDEMLP